MHTLVYVVHFYGPNRQRVYLPYKEYFIMYGDIQKSSSLSRIVEDITHLKQRLEYFERHVHNVRDEETKKEYFRTVAKVLETEVALRHFEEVFNNSK
jgi:hypothetical protein